VAGLASELTTVLEGGELAPPPLADIAYTLAQGRRPWEHRRALVAVEGDSAAAAARLAAGEGLSGVVPRSQDRSVRPAFLFPGQGSHHPGMAGGLLPEPVFRAALERCAAVLRPWLGLDLLALLAPAPSDAAAAGARLQQTAVAQPALFAVEWALAEQWAAWGVTPAGLLGHSLGEYVAACRAGVFSLEAGLALVAQRGRLMATMPPGAMLAVALTEAELGALLGSLPETLPEAAAEDSLALAAINGPRAAVLAGSPAAVAAVAEHLSREGVEHRRLHTAHAFHSPAVDPILEPLGEVLAAMELRPPETPYLSNLTGDWVTATEGSRATDPAFWLAHSREPVRFGAALEKLGSGPLLEVGPGRALATLAARGEEGGAALTIPSLPHPRRRGHPADDLRALLAAVGRLWVAGVAIDWPGFYQGQQRRRVRLPGYPFQRQRFWLEPPARGASMAVPGAMQRSPEKWFYLPSWQRGARLSIGAPRAGLWWLLATPDDPVAAALQGRLEDAGVRVARAATVADLPVDGETPGTVLDLLPLGGSVTGVPRADRWRRGLEPLLELARRLVRWPGEAPVRLLVATRRMHGVLEEPFEAEWAPLLGPLRVFPQERPGSTAVAVDLPPSWAPSLSPSARSDAPETAAALLLAEAGATDGEAVVAYRGGQRWVQRFPPLAAPDRAENRFAPWRSGGVYLLTGAFGGVGRRVTEHLVDRLAGHGGVSLALLHRVPSATLGGERRRWIETLEARGATILPVAGDVTDPEAMARAVTAVEARFGRLHGVLHLATAPDPVRELAASPSSLPPDPKVAGVQALAAALGERPLDFVVVFSSLSTVLGGVGFARYAAANLYAEAFCRQRGAPWLAIAWDGWPEAGLPGLGGSRAGVVDRFRMAPEAALAALERALWVGQGGEPVVVVSTGDLEARRRSGLGNGESEDPIREAPEAPLEVAAAASSGALSSRPPLGTPYRAPRTPVEGAVVEVFGGLLGIDRVGVEDDFFELGGHSLMGTRAVGRLRQRCGVELTVAALFEYPTAAALAGHIGELMGKTGALEAELAGLEEEEAAALLDEIGGLSAAAVAALLTEEPGEGA
jgi:malonyl CoA-acyl carrier protein transacylase